MAGKAALPPSRVTPHVCDGLGMKRPMSGARKGVRLAAGMVGLLLVLSGCAPGPYQPFYHPGRYPDEYNVPDGSS